jgi:subtilisin family serine protease
MTFSRLIVFISVVLMTVSLVTRPGLAQEPPLQPPPPISSSSPIVPGEILVKFQPHVGLRGVQGSLRGEGLFPLAISLRSRVARVAVTPGREFETIAELMARGDVEFASPNYIIKALGDPNDPEFWRQWALKQAQDHDIDAPEAWDNFFSGIDNVTIAIIDTGVDLDHPDLQPNIIAGYDYVNGDTIPDDDHGHGTHVAGIAAAIGNNGVGVAGINWRAKIMPLKILDGGGNGSTFDLSQAIYHAVDNGAKVINMSLGIPHSKWPCNFPEVEAAFDYAVSHGVLLVVASGNDGQNGVNCPAAYNQAIAVGSTTWDDTRSYFSNYGSRLDVVAPGSSIYSTLPGSYGYSSGTSMATPHVAGLAALAWSFAPSLTRNQVKDIIISSVDDLGPVGWDQEYGHGRINVQRTIELISLQTVPDQKLTILLDDDTGPIPNFMPISTANPNEISWTASISPTVPWLQLAGLTGGTVSAASPATVFLATPTHPATYDTYTTSIILTGTTTLDIDFNRVIEVELNYIPKIYEYHLPIFFRN